jgi:alcohol dehydrogenase class IV
VLAVLDGAVAANGYGTRVAHAFDAAVVQVHVVPPGEPSVASVDAAVAAARGLPDPLVVGVGGGSALDTAKQAAIVLAAEPGIEHYLLGRHPITGRRPIVAVPTTSGTGAEVTRTCVLTDRSGRKMWTWGDEMLPDVVILDPQATVTMPPAVTASSGLDAFVHALEAVTGQRRAERPPAPALQAMGLVMEHLPGAVEDGQDVPARAGMQEAAYLAGTAIDGCGSGMAHAIGHALGTLHHVPHGVAVAIGLQATLAWNVAGAPDAFTPVGAALGVPVGDLPDEFERLCHASRFPAVVAALPDHPLLAPSIAEAMVAEENLPMYRNNVRLAADAERLELAARTVEVWHELPAAAA